ncbi:MAG: 3'-5' exonuclease, partial [Candidatus Omnitrophica bacterium]|nr:3'-5' exonuclease [Candidatus Omnitrophota bacterium]
MILEEAIFTVFDFETTGLYPYTGDRICEIGAVRTGIRSGKPATFHSLIDPERPISPGAFRVNGITEGMVKGKPVIDEVLPDFLKFIEGSVLVAYNAGFDLGFLDAALGADAAILRGYYVIDALRLARKLFPSIGRYSLGIVADSLGISAGR